MAKAIRKGKPIRKIDDSVATKLWENGLNDREIGELMGFSSGAVTGWRNRNDYPTNQGIFSWRRDKNVQA